MPTVAFETFNSPSTTRLDPWYNAEDSEEQVVKLADGTYARGTVLGEQVGVSEIDTLTLSCTGGHFTMTVLGQTTANITASASLPTAATLQAALELLSTVLPGGVSVTGSAGGPYTLTWQGILGRRALTTPTADATGLTGGSSTAVVAVSTAGTDGTKGTFGAYNHTHTDGTEIAKCLLRYACVVSSGVVTGISDWGAQSVNAVSAFMRGYFRTEQLSGLDDNALTNMHAAIVEGTAAKGVIRIG